MNIEEHLKDLVNEACKKQAGYNIGFSQIEWNEAKIHTLNDLYANKICLYGNVTTSYFVDTMASILMVMKKITDAA